MLQTVKAHEIDPAAARGTLRMRGLAGLGAILLVAAVFAHVRIMNDWTATGIWLPLDRIFDLAFTGGFLVLAAGLGRRLLQWLPSPRLDAEEAVAFAWVLGLGTLAYGVLALGLLRLLHPPIILGALVLLALLIRHDIRAIGFWLVSATARLDVAVRPHPPSRFVLALAVLLAALFLAALLKALTPPTAPDAIGYHLAAPRLFLEAGGIQRVPWMPRVDFPLTVEMLYLVGLAAGTDIFSQLIHFSYGLLTGLFAFLLGRRLDPRASALALALALSTPAIAVMATWAYSDLGWTFYQTAATYGLFCWWESKDRRWLLLGGIALGFALGSKYLALHMVVLVPPLLGALEVARRRSLPDLIRDLLAFLVPAALVAAPWYIKNALWTGNPVYPFYEPVFRGDLAGGLAYAQALQSYIGLGAGRGPLDYLLLPINVMVQSVRFTGNHAPTAFSPLLLLLPVGFLTGWPRGTGFVAAVAGLLFVLWALGVQETRYYLPGAVLLCALLAVVLARILARYQGMPMMRGAFQATVLAIVFVTVYHQIASGFSGWGRGTLPFIAGFMSRDDFLAEAYWSYDAQRFLREHLSAEDTPLFVGDAGGYYAPARYISDDILAMSWLLPLAGQYEYPKAVRDTGGPVLAGAWERAHAPTMEAALGELYKQDVRYFYLSYVYVEGLTPQEVKDALKRRSDELRDLWQQGVVDLPYADTYGAVLRITEKATSGN